MSLFKSMFSAVRRLISHDHSYGGSESTDEECSLEKTRLTEDASSLGDHEHTGGNGRSESKWKKPTDEFEKFESGNNSDIAVPDGSRGGRGVKEALLGNTFDSEFNECGSRNDNDEVDSSNIAIGPDVDESETENDDTDVEVKLGGIDGGSEDDSGSVTTVVMEEGVTEDEGPIRKKPKLNPEIEFQMQEAAVNKGRKSAVTPKNDTAVEHFSMDTCVISSDSKIMEELPAPLTKNVKDRKLEAVHTVIKHNTELIWLAKFSDKMKAELVPAALMNQYFPQTVIGFYQRRLQCCAKTE